MRLIRREAATLFARGYAPNYNPAAWQVTVLELARP